MISKLELSTLNNCSYFRNKKYLDLDVVCFQFLYSRTPCLLPKKGSLGQSWRTR